MKTSFSKNIIHIVAMGALVVSLFFFAVKISQLPAHAQTGQPGGGGATQNTLLDKSGGVVQFLGLLPKNATLPSIAPVLGSSASTIGLASSTVAFQLLGMSIFDYVYSWSSAYIEEMFVGFATIPETGGGQFQIELGQGVKLHVNGAIQIKELADPNAEPYHPLCHNDFGRLARCPGGDLGTGDGSGNPGSGREG